MRGNPAPLALPPIAALAVSILPRAAQCVFSTSTLCAGCATAFLRRKKNPHETGANRSRARDASTHLQSPSLLPGRPERSLRLSTVLSCFVYLSIFEVVCKLYPQSGRLFRLGRASQRAHFVSPASFSSQPLKEREALSRFESLASGKNGLRGPRSRSYVHVCLRNSPRSRPMPCCVCSGSLRLLPSLRPSRTQKRI